MSVLKARIVNRHGYYLEVQNDGTISGTVKGDGLNGKSKILYGFTYMAT